MAEWDYFDYGGNYDIPNYDVSSFNFNDLDLGDSWANAYESGNPDIPSSGNLPEWMETAPPQDTTTGGSSNLLGDTSKLLAGFAPAIASLFAKKGTTTTPYKQGSTVDPNISKQVQAGTQDYLNKAYGLLDYLNQPDYQNELAKQEAAVQANETGTLALAKQSLTEQLGGPKMSKTWKSYLDAAKEHERMAYDPESLAREIQKEEGAGTRGLGDIDYEGRMAESQKAHLAAARDMYEKYAIEEDKITTDWNNNYGNLISQAAKLPGGLEYIAQRMASKGIPETTAAALLNKLGVVDALKTLTGVYQTGSYGTGGTTSSSTAADIASMVAQALTPAASGGNPTYDAITNLTKLLGLS